MKHYFPVAFFLIYEKLLILLTTLFCSIDYIMMEHVVSSTKGSAHTYSKQLKLKPRSRKSKRQLVVYLKDRFLARHYSYCILMRSRLQVIFADDTNLLYRDKSLPSLESVVNEELTNVYDKLLANKLTLNAQKYGIFHLKEKNAIGYECKSI